MPVSSRTWRRLTLGAAWLALAGSGLACVAEYTAIAAVAETRPLAFGLGLLALGVFAHLSRPRRRRRLAIVGLVLAAVAVGWAARLLWLTYEETELPFESGGVVLRGTLFAPRSAGPHPAVVFLHGSGPTTRRESFYLAKLYARHGIAGFAYDKRGAGESGGSTYGTDYRGYARDALAAMRELRSRAVIDSGRVGLFGHSEGGWVAPVVASLGGDPAFVIATSATDLSPAEQVVYETGAEVLAAGFGERETRRARDLQRRVLAFDRDGGDVTGLNRDLAAAQAQPWFEAADLPSAVDPGLDVTWWRSVMDFDPLPHWRRVRSPVLLVSGGLDRNSDVERSQQRIREALLAGGNRSVTTRIFPRMEHGTVEWWLPGRLPPPRFPPGYPELLVDWTRRQLEGTENGAAAATATPGQTAGAGPFSMPSRSRTK